MQQLIQSYTTPAVQLDHAYGRLLEEIAWLEARLVSIGHTGDCAYEKKLARSYQELLLARRSELSSRQASACTARNNLLDTSARYLLRD